MNKTICKFCYLFLTNNSHTDKWYEFPYNALTKWYPVLANHIIVYIKTYNVGIYKFRNPLHKLITVE